MPPPFQPWTAQLAASEAITATDGRLVPGPTHLTRDGRPVIPVSGELHYSRVPRSRSCEPVARD